LDRPGRLARAVLDRARARRVVPDSTYRLQMHAGFTFRDAERVVPYLAELGISHLYLSPVLAARPGSPHGYDVIDPTRLNPEIGTEADFRSLAAALRARGMGIVLDVVPNHMAVDPASPWWHDVFEHGPSSPYAGYFDIAWDDPPRPDLRGRVMLPLLGAPYYQVLESGELSLELVDGALEVRVNRSAFPVDPRTYDQVLRPAQDRLAGGGGPVGPAAQVHSILAAVRHLPPRTETDPERIREGRVESDVIKRRIAALAAADPAASAALRSAVEDFRATAGRPEAIDRLDALLDSQAYRLCDWRVASDEINYRRFFDINELSALSAEREDVFRDTHDLVLRLAAEGLVDGLRIDHPDGLFDPRQYLARLQEQYLLAIARHLHETDPEFAGDDWAELEPAVRAPLADAARADDGPWLFVVVEKILDRAERLPADWPTAGTTGYEFLNAVNGLFVDPAGEAPLIRTYHAFTGRDESYAEVVLQSRWQVLVTSFSSELGMLTNQLDRLARTNRRARDFTLNGLRRALRAVIAAFPVYRSYITDAASPTDERAVRRAVRDGRRRAPTLSPDLFDFIRDTLLLVPPPSGPPAATVLDEQRRFAGKFQQLTAPVTARGVEDTAFYVYNRLLALNEVGGDPGRFGRTPADVHAFLEDRQARHPGSLSAGSTHDTKRGEDVRTRIDVLSEWPDEWANRVARWAGLNRPHRVELEDGFSVPDPNDEYLLYQTLVGSWPADADTPDGLTRYAERVREYLRKAIHEAKLHTSWINPDPEYDAAVREFVTRVLDPGRSGEFLADLREFQSRVARVGAIHSLAQVLVRCTAPGVPDLYQGTELFDRNLVDPDNRRPVDYPLRERLLAEVEAWTTPPADPADDRARLFVVARALRFRRDRCELFAKGSYEPVEATGPRAGHVFAFLRRFGDAAVLVVVPRLVAPLMEADDAKPSPTVWAGTRLPCPAGWTDWEDGLTGQRLSSGDGGLDVSRVLGLFPVALLTRR
jgi:(1->4)-alpha-D-glucan 1-alpha-D-glucosylmutase